MNAVIVDIQGTYAAALCENGSIRKIPDEHYEIGQKIELPAAEKTAAPKKLRGMSRTMRSLGTIAAVFALTVCTISGIAYATPYGTVSLDADASIEYTINCFNYVIDVKALNEDGDAVLSGIDSSLLLNKQVERAVSATLEQEDSAGTADGETETVISVGTRGQAHSERLAGRLNDMMEHNTSAPAQVIPVTMDDVEAAHENDMTAGRRWMQDNAAPENGTDPGAKPDTAAPDAGTAQNGADAAGTTQNTGTVPSAGSRPAWQSGTAPAGTNSTGTANSGNTQPGTGAAPEQAAQDAPQPGETAESADPAAGTDPGAGSAAPEAPAGGTAAEDPGAARSAAAAEMPAGQENSAPMAETQQIPTER